MRLTHGLLVRLVEDLNNDPEGYTDGHLLTFKDHARLHDYLKMLSGDQVQEQLGKLLEALREEGFPKQHPDPARLLRRINDWKTEGPFSSSRQEEWWVHLSYKLNLPLIDEVLANGSIGPDLGQRIINVESPPIFEEDRIRLAARATDALKRIFEETQQQEEGEVDQPVKATASRAAPQVTNNLRHDPESRALTFGTYRTVLTPAQTDFFEAMKDLGGLDGQPVAESAVLKRIGGDAVRDRFKARNRELFQSLVCVKNGSVFINLKAKIPPAEQPTPKAHPLRQPTRKRPPQRKRR